MSVRGRRVRGVLWGLLAFLLAGIAGTAVWTREAGRPRQGGWDQRPLEGLQVFGTVPEFSFVERNGRRVGLSDLRGKVWIANFIYTHCTETCPLQTAQMARLQADLGGGGDVRLVSITVDPEQDTPEVLAEYARGYGADSERWLFLTGEKAAIYRLAQEGFHLSAVDPTDGVPTPAQNTSPPRGRASSQGQRSRRGESAFAWLFGPTPVEAHPGHAGKPFLHSSRFVLVDRRARIRGYYDSNDEGAIGRLRHDVEALLREDRP